MLQVTEKQKREIAEKFTKYEIARILGARALQVSMNAPILIKTSKEELEQINYDPLKIAEIEFYASVLPITVKRPLPKRNEEKPAKKKEEVKEEAKQEKKKETEKKEVKQEESKGKEVPAEEKKPEAGTLEEVGQDEIMELATPADEAEEEAPAEPEAE